MAALWGIGRAVVFSWGRSIVGSSSIQLGAEHCGEQQYSAGGGALWGAAVFRVGLSYGSIVGCRKSSSIQGGGGALWGAAVFRVGLSHGSIVGCRKSSSIQGGAELWQHCGV